MLQKLADHIATCFERAAEAEQRAAKAPNEAMRVDNERMAQTWRHLARSYQFVESLERFLLDAEKARRAQQPAPPTDTEISVFPPPRAFFDPETIAVLTSAYNKAVDGQSTFVRNAVAKRIIELASEGERDPDKLRDAALASFGISREELHRLAMPRPEQQTSYNWAIYHSGQRPARLVGFIDGAPNKATAIARSIRELRVPASERNRLRALLRH